MIKNLIDVSGRDFGHLHVVELAYLRNGRSYWKCRCICGNEIVLRKDHFLYANSKVKSCGCWHRRESSRRMKEYWHRKREEQTHEILIQADDTVPASENISHSACQDSDV